MRNIWGMHADEQLAREVGEEQDDVLASILLVRGDRSLEDRLFEQLVDLLIEGMFVELRQAYLAAELSRDAYVAELGALVDLLSSGSLLPLRGPLR